LAPAIRQARIDEAQRLTELTLRSKAHWGYDAAFMRDVVDDLTFRPEKFQPDFHVYILECNGQRVGFCSLIPRERETIELHDLFVEPGFIGKGYGKRLWNHAVAVARNLGFRVMILTANPNAEAFYLSQGAVRTGEKPSTVRPDRMVPLMQFLLSR
jgi:GNAT superfamily N-acetyltransferase